MDEARKLVFWQRTIFVVLFICYMFYILDRKAFAFNIPSIIKDEGLDAESIGGVLSSIGVGYAIGKFASGMLVDTYSPSRMFATGLAICGGINIGFGLTKVTALYNILGFCNGLFQGLGWPPCGKLLRRWYSPVMFGTMWSMLSSSMNVAASIGPILSNFITDSIGSWRYSMHTFGTISLLLAVVVLLLIPDTPTQCGFSTNDVEIISNSSAKSTEVKNKSADDNKTDKQTKPTMMSAMQRIARSPFIYVVSFAFFVSLLTKAAVCDWGPLYLITEKNSTKTFASVFSGSLEVGGIVGSILSGVVGDWIVSRRRGHVKGHSRNLFGIPCCIVLLVSLFSLRNFIEDVTVQSNLTLTLASLIGFCLYSIISLCGVMTIEKTAVDISGRSHALAALSGNIGLTTGGLPFSIIVKTFSWGSAFFGIEIFVALLLVALIVSQGINCAIGDLKKEE